MEKSQIISQLKVELKKKLQENVEILDSQPETEYNLDDQIGNFWIVKKAMKESTEDDLIQEVDIFSLAEMISQGTISKADITGMYKMENKARRAVQNGIRGRDKDLKETVKQGSDLLRQLEQKIKDIKTEIQAVTQKGNDNPMLRDSATADIDRLYIDLGKKEAALERLKASLDKEKGETEDKPDEK
jgi:hypothetical protein